MTELPRSPERSTTKLQPRPKTGKIGNEGRVQQAGAAYAKTSTFFDIAPQSFWPIPKRQNTENGPCRSAPIS